MALHKTEKPVIDKDIALTKSMGPEYIIRFNEEQVRESYLLRLESSLDEAGKDGFTEQGAHDHAAKIANEITVLFEKLASFNTVHPFYQAGLAHTGYKRIAEKFDIQRPEVVKDQHTEEKPPAVKDALLKTDHKQLIEIFANSQDPEYMGHLLREMRENAGFSQSDLVKQTSMSKTTISDLELGKTSPRLKTISRYCSGLKSLQADF